MRNGIPQIIAFGDRFSAAYKSIESALPELGELTFQHEKSLPSAEAAVELVRNSSFDAAIMPNPYGNERRLWVYRHLRAKGFPVVVFDRGGLPGSWFFDLGFNADSEAYHPLQWDKPLSQTDREQVRAYLQSIRTEQEPLERQAEARSREELREHLGVTGKKVLLVPFQRPSDTTIKYFCGSIGSFENFCALVNDVARYVERYLPDWTIVAKKHPLETVRPRCNVRFVADEENINSLIELSDMILVVNSGVGLLGSVWNKPVLHAGEAFYAHHDLNRAVRTYQDVVYNLVRPFVVNEETRDRFIWHLRTRVYSFGKFHTELIQQQDGSYRNITREIEFETVRFPDVSKKKRCLLVSSVLPVPINRGCALRTDQMIKGLLGLGYSIDILLLNQSEPQTKSIDIRNRVLDHYQAVHLNVDVRRHPRIVVEREKGKSGWGPVWRRLGYRMGRSLRRWTGEVARINSWDHLPPNFERLVRKRAAGDYDLIWFNYARVVPAELATKAKVVVDLHDIQTERIRVDVAPQLPPRKRESFVRRFHQSEVRVMRSADLCISISSEETERIRQDFSPEARVLTISATSPTSVVSTGSLDSDLLFVGSNATPNVAALVWFFEHVWPLLEEQRPSTISVIGAVCRNRAVANQLASLSGNERVRVKGIVDDLSEEYSKATVVVCPLRHGTGMKIKVVEAMGHGMPLVATSVALAGISSDYGLVAHDEPDDFAQAIVRLLSDPVAIDQARRSSRETHARHHSARYLQGALASALCEVGLPSPSGSQLMPPPA